VGLGVVLKKSQNHHSDEWLDMFHIRLLKHIADRTGHQAKTWKNGSFFFWKYSHALMSPYLLFTHAQSHLQIHDPND
jgi:hypothetical protein